MAKRLLILLFCLMFAGPVAMAHDGPFPMLQAIGIWVSPDYPGMFIVIGAAPIGQTQDVKVRVLIENEYGDVLAEGTTIHRLDDAALNLNLRTNTGVRLGISMTAIERTAHASPANVSLVMSFNASEDQGKFPVGVKYFLIRK